MLRTLLLRLHEYHLAHQGVQLRPNPLLSPFPPESIQQPVTREPPSPLHIALGLMFEKSGASRKDCVRFREVTNLSQSLNNVEDPLELPAKLDTLALDSPALGHMIIPTFDEPRNAHDYLIALY